MHCHIFSVLNCLTVKAGWKHIWKNCGLATCSAIVAVQCNDRYRALTLKLRSLEAYLAGIEPITTGSPAI